MAASALVASRWAVSGAKRKLAGYRRERAIAGTVRQLSGLSPMILRDLGISPAKIPVAAIDIVDNGLVKRSYAYA